MATHSGILALENPMDRGAWRATVHGATRRRTQLRTKRSSARVSTDAGRGRDDHCDLDGEFSSSIA